MEKISTTTKIDVRALQRTFDSFWCHLERMPDREQMNDLVYNVENRYYTQLVYRFPPEYVAVVIEYFEREERYEICSKIVQEISTYVKINGEDIPTKLEKCA